MAKLLGDLRNPRSEEFIVAFLYLFVIYSLFLPELCLLAGAGTPRPGGIALLASDRDERVKPSPHKCVGI